MADRITITHYSDALCVWAYIAQARITELEEDFPGQVEIEYRFLQVFGDVAGKMATQWADRGGLQGYAAHVQEVAAQFEHIEVASHAWLDNTPRSSLPAHLMLCGLRAANDQPEDILPTVLRGLRRAFFVERLDISAEEKLLEIVADCGANMDSLIDSLRTGAAHAQLSADLTAAAQTGVRSSPTLVFNEGRQTLAGNVGYRVIEANIRELLRNPADQQSWC